MANLKLTAENPMAEEASKRLGNHGNLGSSRPRGRPKGVPNKINADVKAAIVEAF
jgi:hypothetical protein